MVAEAAHSWADTGNEVFLLVAERKAARPPDQDRPLGYGREAYVWSMLVASIDLPGDESESHVAVRLRALGRQLERAPQIVDAVLTLAVPGDR